VPIEVVKRGEKMPEKKRAEAQASRRKPLRPSVKIIIAAVLLLLLILVGIRLHGWLSQRDETRVIVLVNPWNDVDNCGFRPRLKSVEGVELDSSCIADLERMLADCRASGCSITLTAGYRSREEQLMLFNNEVDRQMGAGYSADQAYSIAEQRVGLPGASEHELGLAIDVQGASAQAWMRENAWRYGFILRYPEGCETITGRSADSAHYRYVGETAAFQIYELNITLEEYMGMFYTQEAEIVIE
jgi:D-alanyl-D-alanine carboxypeptidase